MVPRVGNSDDEIEGLILCFVFAIDENIEKDLHQPYATTSIPHFELQIWRDHKKLYSEKKVYIGDIPKAHQDHIYLKYYKDRTLLINDMKDGRQISIFLINEMKDEDQIRIWTPPGLHVKKAGVHVVNKPKEAASIAEKLSEFFTSSTCSYGVNEGESTSVRGANNRGHNDEDEEIVRGKSKRNVPFLSEVHQQPLHKFIDGGDNSREICSDERIAGQGGVAYPFIDVDLRDELVYDGSNRRAMDPGERRAGEGVAEPFTDLGFRLFCCFLILVVLPVIMAWSIGMGFY